jgi:lysophospholipase L1-like esterase
MSTVQESTELRITRMLYVASLLISTVLIIGLAYVRPMRSNITASYVWAIALVLGTVLIGACKGRRKRYLPIFLLIAALNIILVPPELYLRLKGFRFESGIQFGYPRPYQFNAFEPDEKLFWRFRPTAPSMNSYGFETAEVTRPRPAGIYRILFLGNSCTHQGAPILVESIMRGTHPEVECLNFSTPGYTTYQGRIIAQSYLAEFEPHLLVVSYGWNDRWLAYGSPDETKKIVVSSNPAAAALSRLYSRWRLLQFVRKGLSPIMGSTEPLAISRVPIDQFKKNLETIGSEAEKLGIPVIYVTEPSSHPIAGVPDYVVLSKYAKSKETSLALLKEYNDVVREVARERSSWTLIDLDAAMSSRSDVRKLFTADGIHYSPTGTTVVAEIYARFILDHFLTPHGAK